MAAGGPRGLGVDRVPEGDQATDDPDSLGLEGLYRLGEVVVRRHGPDLERRGQLGVVADDPRLVLEVELHGVDQAAVDQVHHAGAELVVGPRGAADVNGVRAVRVDDRHDDVRGGAVAGLVDGHELERARGRGVERRPRTRRRRPRARSSAEPQLRSVLDRARHGDRIGDRNRVEVGGQVEGGRDAVDDVAPREGGVAEEHAGHGQLDRVLALGQGLLDQLGLDQLGRTDPHRSAIGLRLQIIEQRDPVHLQLGAEQLVARVEGDRDVEVAGHVRRERSPVVDPGGRRRRPGSRPRTPCPSHTTTATAPSTSTHEEEVDLTERPLRRRASRPVQAQRAGRQVELAARATETTGLVRTGVVCGRGWPRGCP